MNSSCSIKDEQIQKFESSVAVQDIFRGNIGISIFLYQLSRVNVIPKYEKIADDLLDKVISNLSLSTSSDFENGLAGIGWGIEYLVQNGFAEGNTDEILEEVDNKVFRTLNEENVSSFELTNGLTGYLLYLTNRLKNKSNPPSMAQQINRELLIRTINKLDEVVTSQFSTIVKEIQFDLFWRFPVMLYGLIEAFKLNIHKEKIKCMVKQWLPYLEAYIPSMHINRLYMATVLTKINELIPHNRLEKQIQILLFATDFEILKTEVDPHAQNIRFGWTGLVWLMQQASVLIPTTYPNYEIIRITSKEIKEKYTNFSDKTLTISNEENHCHFGLINGIAGIGLMELLFPEVFINMNLITSKNEQIN